MNGTDDFIIRLEEYLGDFDGPTPLPEFVRDAVHAELPGTRRAGWQLPGRDRVSGTDRSAGRRTAPG